MNDFGMYLVMTNPVVGYERCCEAAVRAGVRMVQLRMKDAPRADVVAVARELRRITLGSDTKLIVNDDPAAAAEAEADGVHVGQTDMPVAEVRRLFPSLGIVGKSTHSLAQAVAAQDEKPDYIGVGPVWATPTKKIPDPTLGVANAAEMMRASRCPAVAIGGVVDAAHVAELAAAGFANFAVVRAVCASDDPYAAIKALQTAFEEARRVSRTSGS
ncbi:MAG: thiamine phosphate synthase [Kiritimatiellae bacterium]|nr:thiamine phosphate synthase [Kiritimatiellia bacterium]